MLCFCVFFYVFLLYTCPKYKELEMVVGGKDMANPSFSKIFGFLYLDKTPYLVFVGWCLDRNTSIDQACTSLRVNISLNKTVQIWSLCGVLLLNSV